MNANMSYKTDFGENGYNLPYGHFDNYRVNKRQHLARNVCEKLKGEAQSRSERKKGMVKQLNKQQKNKKEKEEKRKRGNSHVNQEQRINGGTFKLPWDNKK